MSDRIRAHWGRYRGRVMNGSGARHQGNPAVKRALSGGETRDWSAYRSLHDRVADQLADQLPPGPALPVLIPTVGFGRQSEHVLDQTLCQLAGQEAPVPISVVLLVNRPQTRAADGTAARARKLGAALNSASVRFAVAELALPDRPKLGELRQLLLDAVILVQGLDPAVTTCVVADDDMVRLPPGLLADLYQAVTGRDGIAAAVGPVLFDSPDMPAPMLPAFFVADALRALLAARLLREWGMDSVDPAQRAEFDQYAESLALSCNLAVSAAAVQDAGGFAPLNEITNLVRSVYRTAGTVAGTWDFDPACGYVLVHLHRHALHISARRALAAYHQTGAPSVGQWRACRFRSSRIDPVRITTPPTAEPTWISDLHGRNTDDVIAEMNAVLTTTLSYFPVDLEVIEDCLGALGLTMRSVSVNGGTPVVRIREATEVLDRLRLVQEHLVGTDIPALPA